MRLTDGSAAERAIRARAKLRGFSAIQGRGSSVTPAHPADPVPGVEMRGPETWSQSPLHPAGALQGGPVYYWHSPIDGQGLRGLRRAASAAASLGTQIATKVEPGLATGLLVAKVTKRLGGLIVSAARASSPVALAPDMRNVGSTTPSGDGSEDGRTCARLTPQGRQAAQGDTGSSAANHQAARGLAPAPTADSAAILVGPEHAIEDAEVRALTAVGAAEQDAGSSPGTQSDALGAAHGTPGSGVAPDEVRSSVITPGAAERADGRAVTAPTEPLNRHVGVMEGEMPGGGWTCMPVGWKGPVGPATCGDSGFC